MELPVLMRAGLTIEIDIVGGEAAVRIRGADSQHRPISLHLRAADLTLLQEALAESKRRYGA